MQQFQELKEFIVQLVNSLRENTEKELADINRKINTIDKYFKQTTPQN